MELRDIKSPRDIKGLDLDQLKAVAEEIRSTIIDVVSTTGGHLASSLGVVELTIALHYVFETPYDKIVWDVGHQSYPHKLLTGRYEQFPTLRQYKGLGGFPKREESPYDSFDTGHSSTSISAAVGMLEARDLKHEKYKVIAVIGDGAMTAGLAFEGLNHAGQLKKDMIVILNDNEMSISPNVGALSSYLNRILTGDTFKRLRRDVKSVLESIPGLGGPMSRFAFKLEEALKGLILPGLLFEELGFMYVGPIDGHNLNTLIDTFENIKTVDKPVLMHVVTKKGKGYEYSEEDPCTYHGVGPFEVEVGFEGGKGGAASITYSDVLGRTLSDIADENRDVVTITAAMTEGCGLAPFVSRHPERFYDVGIAEPHAVTFAAGMASQGARPVVAIYSTFLQRSYDEIIHDVCLQGLPVVFAIDRGGIVGEDGPTHQGVFDLSYLRHIPGLTVMAPKDGDEMRAMLRFAVAHDGPVAVRYPRGRVVELGLCPPLEMGRAEVLSKGAELAILAVGHMTGPVLQAAELLAPEGIRPTVVNMRFVKPLDLKLIKELASTHPAILTVEENILQGGFGSAVTEALVAEGIVRNVALRCVGIPDEYVEQGKQDILRKLYGLDAEGIAEAAQALLRSRPSRRSKKEEMGGARKLF
jgi:1-deoxy-D-xylulose-5-phosphate synthase